MDRAQAEFLGGVRKHIHDHIVGRYEPRYALTESGWESHRTMPIAARIDGMEDRLFAPGTLAVRGRVGAPMGAQLRGARMFDPRGGARSQEQTLSHADQEELMDLAALMRGVTGETKAWLGAFLESDHESLRRDELHRLKTALDWLKVAETAFRSVPMEIVLVRDRRSGRLPTAERGEGLSPAVREMMKTYVIDEETEDATQKLIDDGDVFNDFKAGLGALRQAWFKVAMAMVTAPPEMQPSEPEVVAAFAEDGLTVERDEIVVLGEATPNRRATPNGFGWPRASRG